MHGAIRDRLEELLRPGRAAKSDPEAGSHLAACDECAGELKMMKAQAGALRSLKGPSEVEVSASFYAGVLRKIEEKKASSMWYNLIASPISARFVYVAFTIAVIVGSYVISHEASDGHLEANSVLARNVHYDAVVYGDQDQQRDAVLTNFATH